MHALIGAYKKEGYEWVDELCQVLGENIDYACEHINNNYHGIKFFKPEGTYMLYLDCEEWLKKHNMTLYDLYKKGTDVGVMWQDGRPFNHPCAIRLNLALPKSKVIEAFERLDKYVF
jgi:cystathionine beta-lyase